VRVVKLYQEPHSGLHREAVAGGVDALNVGQHSEPRLGSGDVTARRDEHCSVCGFTGPRERYIPHDCYWTLMAIQRRHRVGTAEAMRIQAARYCGPVPE
jgi:hypothetical protein